MTLDDFRRWPVRAGKRLARIDLLLIPLALALFVGGWHLLVRWRGYPSFVLPGPGVVWNRFVALLADGTLATNTGTTLLEIFGGLSVGLTAALVIGYGLAKSPLLERILSPYIVASQAIPIVAIAPLLAIWFGYGITPKIVTSLLIVFFPILVSVVAGIRSVEPNLRDLMRSLRADRWQMFTKLEVPSALPLVLSGLKVGATLAVIGAIVGEFVNSDRGLGFLIKQGNGEYNTARTFAALIALVVMALLMYGSVALLERKWLAWRK